MTSYPPTPLPPLEHPLIDKRLSFTTCLSKNYERLIRKWHKLRHNPLLQTANGHSQETQALAIGYQGSLLQYARSHGLTQISENLMGLSEMHMKLAEGKSLNKRRFEAVAHFHASSSEHYTIIARRVRQSIVHAQEINRLSSSGELPQVDFASNIEAIDSYMEEMSELLRRAEWHQKRADSVSEIADYDTVGHLKYSSDYLDSSTVLLEDAGFWLEAAGITEHEIASEMWSQHGLKLERALICLEPFFVDLGDGELTQS